MANPAAMATKPTVRETRAPQMVRENMSRPLVSVPNHVAHPGLSIRPP